MTPLEFLARLASLVPPPRYPLLRYHGVLAPKSSWRRDVIPRPPGAQACERARAPAKPEPAHGEPRRSAKRERPEATAAPQRTASAQDTTAHAATAPSSTEARPPLPAALRALGASAAPGAVLLAPNILGVKHWDRLLGGALYAATPRLDWPTLLRRSFDVDILQCARCGGRLRVLGEVTEPAMVRLVLESLGMPTEGPTVARARDPTESLGNPESEA
jgi:hypothetical protein